MTEPTTEAGKALLDVLTREDVPLVRVRSHLAAGIYDVEAEARQVATRQTLEGLKEARRMTEYVCNYQLPSGRRCNRTSDHGGWHVFMKSGPMAAGASEVAPFTDEERAVSAEMARDHRIAELEAALRQRSRTIHGHIKHRPHPSVKWDDCPDHPCVDDRTLLGALRVAPETPE